MPHQVFDLSRKAALVCSYSLAPGRARLLPVLLKEGGGSKLLLWGDRLLAVCPEVAAGYYEQSQQEHQPQMVLRIFSVAELLAGQPEPGPLLLDHYTVPGNAQ